MNENPGQFEKKAICDRQFNIHWANNIIYISPRKYEQMSLTVNRRFDWKIIIFVTLYVWGVHVALQLLDAHLWNGTGHRIVTMTALLLLTSGLVRYEAVLHGCGTSPVGRWVLTCDWWLYSAATLDHQAAATMTCYPTQLRYPDT